jgi:hypothetical protein
MKYRNVQSHLPISIDFDSALTTRRALTSVVSLALTDLRKYLSAFVARKTRRSLQTLFQTTSVAKRAKIVPNHVPSIG